MATYSHFFQTLHDETAPTGYLGQGTHSSVFRAIAFHDSMGAPLSEGRFANFAVIWDQDHDTRVIEPIERIYRRGLLSSFLIFGEHKGVFNAILSPSVSSAASSVPFDPAFLKKVDELGLSVRASNCLKHDNVIYIGDLVQKTEGELLRTPNFGQRPLDEIKEMLESLGLYLGMESPGWPPENVEQLAGRIDEVTKRRERVPFLETEVNAICQSLGDPWPSKIAPIESPGRSIIDDREDKVGLYLKNLVMLWQLGLESRFKRRRAALASRPAVIAQDGAASG
jgi:hypothetical protein